MNNLLQEFIKSQRECSAARIRCKVLEKRILTRCQKLRGVWLVEEGGKQYAVRVEDVCGNDHVTIYPVEELPEEAP